MLQGEFSVLSEVYAACLLPSHVLIQMDAYPQLPKAINEEQDDLRNAEFQQKREAYLQLANNIRVSSSPFFSSFSLVFEGYLILRPSFTKAKYYLPF